MSNIQEVPRIITVCARCCKQMNLDEKQFKYEQYRYGMCCYEEVKKREGTTI